MAVIDRIRARRCDRFGKRVKVGNHWREIKNFQDTLNCFTVRRPSEFLKKRNRGAELTALGNLLLSPHLKSIAQNDKAAVLIAIKEVGPLRLIDDFA